MPPRPPRLERLVSESPARALTLAPLLGAPLTLAAGSTKGTLTLAFAARMGPFNQPVVVRATLTTPQGPVTAETPLELVAGD